MALAASVVGYGAISIRVAEAFSHAERLPVGDPRAIAATSEDVSFRSSDGLLLRGWFFPASPDRAVVLVHGRNQTRSSERKDDMARFLIAAGYSVLAFDLRAHGESEGDRFSLGQHERKDVAAAIDYLGGRGFPPGRVALLGLSMGAATALQSIALRPAVGPVIADSAYAEGRVVVEENAPSVTGLPSWFSLGILAAAGVIFGLDASAADPLAVVRAYPDRPYLFIECDADRTVAPHHALELHRASPESELWVAHGCDHVGAFLKYRAEYERRVLAFLEAHLR